MPVGLAGVIVSPAGYLLYFRLDPNALIGEVDGIIGDGMNSMRQG